MKPFLQLVCPICGEHPKRGEKNREESRELLSVNKT